MGDGWSCKVLLIRPLQSNDQLPKTLWSTRVVHPDSQAHGYYTVAHASFQSVQTGAEMRQLVSFIRNVLGLMLFSCTMEGLLAVVTALWLKMVGVI